jgi:hypothetical protein
MVKARTFDSNPEAGLEPVPLQRAIPPAAASLLFGTRRHYSRVHDSNFLLSRRGSRQVPIAPQDFVPRPSNGEQLPSRPVDGPVGKRAERAACATGTNYCGRARFSLACFSCVGPPWRGVQTDDATWGTRRYASAQGAQQTGRPRGRATKNAGITRAPNDRRQLSPCAPKHARVRSVCALSVRSETRSQVARHERFQSRTRDWQCHMSTPTRYLASMDPFFRFLPKLAGRACAWLVNGRRTRLRGFENALSRSCALGTRTFAM